MYLQRVSFYPQLGKEQDMRHHLEAWAKTRQSQGGKIALSTALFSAEGMVFVFTIRLNDLAELDQLRQRQRTDQAFQEFLAKTSALSHRAPRVELHEVIVAMPG